MSRFKPAAVALLRYATAASSAVAADCRAHAPHSTCTVRMSARFHDCGPQEGFGFVVGERHGKLYAVTAQHVVCCDHDGLPATPPKAAARAFIEASFCFTPDEPVTPERIVPGPAGLELA